MKTLAAVIGLSLITAHVHAQDYSGSWTFYGYDFTADPGVGAQLEDFPLTIQLNLNGNGGTIVANTPEGTQSFDVGDEGGYYSFSNSYEEDFGLVHEGAIFYPIDENHALFTFANGDFNGTEYEEFYYYSSTPGIFHRGGFSPATPSTWEGSYDVTLLQSYASNRYGESSGFGLDMDSTTAVIRSMGGNQYEIRAAEDPSGAFYVQQSGNMLAYDYEGHADDDSYDREIIRIYALDENRLIFMTAAAFFSNPNYEELYGGDSTIALATRTGPVPADAYAFFPGAGQPRGDGWIQWRSGWFLTSFDPWFYSYTLDWTYITSTDPNNMWWWSMYFAPTGGSTWIWTNQSYFPWVYEASTNQWYDTSGQ